MGGENSCSPRGTIQAFRLQLWSAHLGIKEPAELDYFREPHDPAVVERVKNIAEATGASTYPKPRVNMKCWGIWFHTFMKWTVMEICRDGHLTELMMVFAER